MITIKHGDDKKTEVVIVGNGVVGKMVENPLGKEKVAKLPEQTTLDIKVPFFYKMELTIKSLSEGAFIVKRDKKKWNVCFKRIIVVGGLFDEQLAKCIAVMYNNITDKIKEGIQSSMAQAEKRVQQAFDCVCRDVVNGVSGIEKGDGIQTN